MSKETCYFIFGPDISDEEFDKKLEEDRKRLEEHSRNLRETVKRARELLGLPEEK